MSQNNNRNSFVLVGKVSSIEKNEGPEKDTVVLMLNVPRLSENYDTVPIVVNDDERCPAVGQYIEAKGIMCTYDLNEDDRRRVLVYARAIITEVLTSESYNGKSEKNRVYLDAHLCKLPVKRTTNSGRIITDLILAHNRITEDNKRVSYYFPCISWGNVAKQMCMLSVGTKVYLVGRFQSRRYRRNSDTEEHTAYEISILDYEKVQKDKKKEGVTNVN